MASVLHCWWRGQECPGVFHRKLVTTIIVVPRMRVNAMMALVTFGVARLRRTCCVPSAKLNGGWRNPTASSRERISAQKTLGHPKLETRRGTAGACVILEKQGKMEWQLRITSPVAG